MFDGKVVMITGGTGSFGHTILQPLPRDRHPRDPRSSAATRRSRRTCASRSTSPKVQVLHRRRAQLRQRSAGACAGVDYVFHAAALKQVPSCEFYPMEAVQTNVLGTENVLNAAIANGVERVVVLSTDKAVYPINAMGMSKALMEKVHGRQGARAARRRARRSVRHALRQRHGARAARSSRCSSSRSRRASRSPSPIRNMTRFLMSLDESVDLVLHAFRARQAGRHLRAEGAGLHGRRPGAGAQASIFDSEQRRSGSSARATARSSTSRWSRARNGASRRTWAASCACPPITAISTTRMP